MKPEMHAYNDLAIHPPGDVLATRLDGAHVWRITPENNKIVLLIMVEGLNATSGITKVSDKMYVFGAGDYSPDRERFVTGSLRLFKINLAEDATNPGPQLLTSLAGPWRHAVLATWSETMVLVAGDTTKGVIHSYNLDTETIDSVIEDKHFDYIPDVGVYDGEVYYIRGGDVGKKGELCRISVDDDFHAIDDCYPISQDPGVKKFDFGADGMIYALASLKPHHIMTVEDLLTDPRPEIQSLPNCVALKVGRGPCDEEVLYVATEGVDALTGQARIATINLEPIKLKSD